MYRQQRRGRQQQQAVNDDDDDDYRDERSRNRSPNTSEPVLDIEPPLSPNGALPMFLPPNPKSPNSYLGTTTTVSPSKQKLQQRQHHHLDLHLPTMHHGGSEDRSRVSSTYDQRPQRPQCRRKSSTRTKSTPSPPKTIVTNPSPRSKAFSVVPKPYRPAPVIAQSVTASTTSRQQDMRYDDDEFAYTAHLIMHHITLEQQQQDAQCTSFQELYQAWHYLRGGDSTSGGGGDDDSSSASFQFNNHDQNHDQNTTAPDTLTQDAVAEFQFALKHRLKFIPLRSSPSKKNGVHQHHLKEDDMTKLTRQVAQVIAKHGYPTIKKQQQQQRNVKPKTKNKDPFEDRGYYYQHQESESLATLESEDVYHSRPPTVVDGAGSIQTMEPIVERPPTAVPAAFVAPPPTVAIPPPPVVVPQPTELPVQQQPPPPKHFFPEQTPVAPSSQYVAPDTHVNTAPALYVQDTATRQQQEADFIRQQYQQEQQQRYQQNQQQYQQQYHQQYQQQYHQQYQQQYHQQYQQQYYQQQQQQPSTFYHPEEEPVFEILNDHNPVVDAYEEEPLEVLAYGGVADRRNLIQYSNNGPDEIYVGIDRSFEEDAVVMRELNIVPQAHFPVVDSDGSLTDDLVVTVDAAHGDNTRSLSPQRSIQRQHVMEEAKRVSTMMQLTSNPQVKHSCQGRLEALRNELERLTVYEMNAFESRTAGARFSQSTVTTVAEEKKDYVHSSYSNNTRSNVTQLEEEGRDESLSSSPVVTKPAPVPPVWTNKDVPSPDDVVVPPARNTAASASLLPSPLTAARHECDTSQRTHVWKDKLMDCFAYGPCHASVSLTIVMPFLALAQVMVRLQTVGWLALPYTKGRNAFRVAILLTMFWITVNCLLYYLAVVSLVLKLILFGAVNATFLLYYAINVIRVRWHVRKRYHIVTTKRSDYSIGGCAPHLCTMQLLRHTGDYDTYSGQWFTATGIPVHVKLQMPTLSVHNSTFTDGDQGSIMSRAGKNQHGDTTIMASSAVDTIEQDEPFAQQKYYYLI